MPQRLTRLLCVLAVALMAAKQSLAQDDNQMESGYGKQQAVTSQHKALEEYEPEYRELPELKKQYGLKLDKNHPLPITS